MTENADMPANKPGIWVRGFIMLLMAFILQMAGTVLFALAILQFILALLNDKPNARLVSFGRSLACYFQQAVSFLTFASDETPFPFSDWPEGD